MPNYDPYSIQGSNIHIMCIAFSFLSKHAPFSPLLKYVP